MSGGVTILAMDLPGGSLFDPGPRWYDSIHMEWIRKKVGFREVDRTVVNLRPEKTGRTFEFFFLKKFNSSPCFFGRHYSSDTFCHRLVW